MAEDRKDNACVHPDAASRAEEEQEESESADGDTEAEDEGEKKEGRLSVGRSSPKGPDEQTEGGSRKDAYAI